MDFSGEHRICVSYIPHCDRVPNKSKLKRQRRVSLGLWFKLMQPILSRVAWGLGGVWSHCFYGLESRYE